jgi:hypothetical protein
MPKLYYRIEPRGSQLARRSTETTDGEPLPPGYIFVFDAPTLLFASDTFYSASFEPEDWEVVELHGRDAYDPGDIEGVAVKPTSVVRRSSLYEWTARQARGRDASAREYARSALERMKRRAAVPHRLDEDEPEAVVIRPVGWEATNDTPPSWARPGHLYRGMSEAEWRFVQQSGVIRSDERFSVSGEGTNFAEDPGDAESYVNFGSTDPRKTGKPNYLVEIKNDGSLKRWGDGYWKAREVPASLITRAWIMYPEAGAVMAAPVAASTSTMREAGCHEVVGVEMRRQEKVEILKRAALWLNEHDPDSFHEGCGDVSIALERFAEMIGLENVVATAGTTPKTGFHAWLEVDGTLFDPVAFVEGFKPGKYKKDPAVLSMLVCGLFFDEELERMKRDLIEGRELTVEAVVDGCLTGDDDPRLYYHATPARNLARVRKEGLVPGSGETFDTGKWSKGKVFLTRGRHAADQWREAIYEMTFEPIALVAVRVPQRMRVHIDAVAAAEGDTCVYYVEGRIPPENVSVIERGAGLREAQAARDVWYHGSPQRFERFQSRIGHTFGTSASEVPIFLTRDPEFAALYAGPKGYVYEVRPHVERTFDASAFVLSDRYWPPEREALTPEGQKLHDDLAGNRIFPKLIRYGTRHEGEDEWAAMHDSQGTYASIVRRNYDVMETTEMKRWLRAHGYDSFLVSGDGPDDNLAVLDPERVEILSVRSAAS